VNYHACTCTAFFHAQHTRTLSDSARCAKGAASPLRLLVVHCVRRKPLCEKFLEQCLTGPPRNAYGCHCENEVRPAIGVGVVGVRKCPGAHRGEHIRVVRHQPTFVAARDYYATERMSETSSPRSRPLVEVTRVLMERDGNTA